ncbi:IclR family transcriptional regulator C-terminal domain-containing protein [Comamonas sp. JUb58]|uniref:IclR family transcriptional regulator domain-containing protein n=1 Tax=Comamonas sp. JUb58 TaxID=2485114 RepID=UPI00105C0E12|nr:IclR family transcriptional regulator C-terminal domain-containing protein [Comamonas sp. JUb58]TDS79332.1 IclR family transcriptional regulator [Comamonas sp. JUb58]
MKEEDPTLRPSDSYVQSFARGLEVIRSFGAAAPRQTLTEVAEATGMTRAGARRILLTLQTLGYVRVEGRLFALTPRILDLGFAYLSSMPVWNLAQPVMDALVEQTHESCSIAVLDGQDVVYVLRVHTHKIMSTNLGMGSRLPSFWTSLGRVLLAELPEQELQPLLDGRDRTMFTRFTIQDDAQLLTELAQVRAEGWCLLNQELEEGLTSVAAPIRNASGQVVAAMNISGQANRTTPEIMQGELLPQLLQAAGRVSGLLGYQAGRGIGGKLAPR